MANAMERAQAGQAAPAQEEGQAAAAQGQGQGPQNSAMQLVGKINEELMMLAELFQRAGAPEQELNALAGIIKGYQQIVQRAFQGGGEQEKQAPQGGAVPVQEGGAVPAV